MHGSAWAGRLACVHVCMGGQAGMWHKGGGSMRGSMRNMSRTHIPCTSHSLQYNCREDSREEVPVSSNLLSNSCTVLVLEPISQWSQHLIGQCGHPL